MPMTFASFRLPALLTVALLAAAPANAVPQNPPPARKLAGFASYELKPMAIDPALSDKKNAEKVVATVQEHAERTLAPIVAKWNAEAASAPGTGKLVIEPRITALHKPSGATRFFAGAFAGDGRIVITVKIHDDTGTLIAEPEFYRRANAMAGAWTVGAHDNAMLGKVVGLIADYLNANYSEAVGGVTGYEP
jgi:hypothetical protein